MGIPVKNTIIYGPVPSRRLGRSLGINLLSKTKKVCTFDCIYCQYGRTSKEKEFAEFEEVIEEVKKALETYKEIDYLTYSGNGEPTYHPQFYEIAKEIKKLRDEIRPDVPIALLTNSTGVIHDKVKKAIIEFIDVPIFKIDCSNEEDFKKINCPVIDIKFIDIINGIKELRRFLDKLYIQSLFIKGKVSNFTDDSLNEWYRIMRDIKPDFVQVYSLDRPFDAKGIEEVSIDELKTISRRLNNYGINAKAYGRRNSQG